MVGVFFRVPMLRHAEQHRLNPASEEGDVNEWRVLLSPEPARHQALQIQQANLIQNDASSFQPNRKRGFATESDDNSGHKVHTSDCLHTVLEAEKILIGRRLWLLIVCKWRAVRRVAHTALSLLSPEGARQML